MHKRTPSDSAADLPPTEFLRLNLVGRSPAFVAALSLISRFSKSAAPVLIQGETGTGKELAARAIHYLGPRHAAPFIPVNCGAVPDGLIESEFFGHKRGAFTDAKEHRTGVIEQAVGGTLFLDELDTLSPRGQVVLLRFLQDLTYRAVGGTVFHRADVRIVGSSNVDLEALVHKGLFRRDLLFRLSVLTLELPPLRARGDDVSLLAERFIARFSADYGVPARPLDQRSCEYLVQHAWPGNVRELENLVHRTLVMSDGPQLSFPGISFGSGRSLSAGESARAALIDQRFREAKASAIAQFEREYMTALLQRTHGNLSLAARLSGKERSRLGKLLKKYGLQRVAYATTPPDH